MYILNKKCSLFKYVIQTNNAVYNVGKNKSRFNLHTCNETFSHVCYTLIIFIKTIHPPSIVLENLFFKNEVQ